MKTAIRAEFSCTVPPKHPYLKLLHWSGNHWDDVLYFPKNYHVGCVTHGKGSFKQGHKLLPISAGQFFFIHPGNLHTGKPDTVAGWAAQSLVIEEAFIKAIFLQKGVSLAPSFNPMVVADGVLNHSLAVGFNQLVCSIGFANGDELATAELKTLLYNLISKASTGEQPEAQHQQAVQQAVSYLEHNFRQPFLLNELAAAVGLSKFHLQRVFKAQTGYSPKEFQIHLRLNAARKLLFQEKLLTDVATELGFTDQAHFINTFKRYSNGVKPNQLKQTAIFYNFSE